MTRDEAIAFATDAAKVRRRDMEVWAHVGGRTPTGRVLPQGRFVVRDTIDPPPSYVWNRIMTIAARGSGPVDELPPEERTPEEVGQKVIERLKAQRTEIPDPVRLAEIVTAAVREDREARDRQIRPPDVVIDGGKR